MLGNIFLKTLRDYRYQIVGWGLGLAGLMVAQVLAYYNFFKGPDAEKMTQDYKQTAESFSFFFGKVYDVETLGGYIHFEIMIYLPVLLGIFAVMAGSGIIRGEEEKGSLDLLLSTPRSRIAVVLGKWAAITLAIAVIAALGWLGLVIGAAVANVELDSGAALVAHLNIVLVALIFGSLALFFAQLMPSRKAAAGWAGGFLAATYLMNSMAQTFESLRWLRNFSPFYYYDLSKPMARSVGTDWGAILLLAFIPIPLLVAAVLMYLKRDHNNIFRLIGQREVSATKNIPKLAEPKGLGLLNTFIFGLKASWFSILVWSFGIAIYILIIMSAFNGMRDGMLRLMDNEFYRMLGFAIIPSNESLVDLSVFLFLLPLCAAYTIIQIASWTGEENNGRLELILSVPEPRWRLLLGRFAATISVLAFLIAIIGAVFALSTQLFNVPVNTSNAVAAFFGVWVVCVIVAAAGFVLAAFWPGWSVAITGTLVVISYFITFLGTALKLPDWAIDLSVFHQYGRPQVDGLNWLPVLVLLGLSAVFVLVGCWRFEQRDIAK